VLDLGGEKVEGIFQIPGSPSDIISLRLSIESGDYRNPFSDPHVPASLLKLWLRELSLPVIPPEFYKQAIECAQIGDPSLSCELVEQLPKLSVKVLKFIIGYLKKMVDSKHASNLDIPIMAMIFAPNLLRCVSEDPSVILARGKLQQIFVEHLLTNLKI